MLSLSGFFQKFKNLEHGKREVALGLIKSIELSSNIILSESEVLVDSGVARINTSPMKRNEIFMHKEEILSNLKSLNSSVKDIR